MSFINAVLESTSEYEAPRRFYYWSSLAAISAILKDRVWWDMGKQYNLYPNIYVLLYGPSGVRKGPAIALAERLVRKVNNTRVINGRASIEGIFKELGTMYSRERQELIKDSCGFVIASELSSSIISNTSAMDIMTHLYDRIWNEGEWKYTLKTSDSIKLNRPTITWLSGTNEALFKDFVPEKNIKGGLIGRMFMIAETKTHRFNSLMFAPKIFPDLDVLAKLLKPAADLKGEFQASEELRHEIDEWYLKFQTEVAPQIKDETGFVSRVLDFLVKVAMLLAVGRRMEMIVIKSDWDEALEVTLPLIIPTQKLVQSAKKIDPSETRKRALVLEYIVKQENYTTSRKEILKNLSLELNHEDLDKVVTLLLQFDAIKMQHNGADIIYQLNMGNPKIKMWIERNFIGR